MIAVMGASGEVGSKVTDLLLQENQDVLDAYLGKAH